MKELMKRYGKWFNKRVLTTVGLCLLLAAAIVTNILVNRKGQNAKETGTQKTSDVTQVSSQTRAGNMDFFAAYREERDSVRTQELAYLDAIVSQGADTDTLSDAQRQKMELVNVIVSIHKGNINVVVGTDALNDEQVAQILDIVLRETGKTAENVKISTTL